MSECVKNDKKKYNPNLGINSPNEGTISLTFHINLNQMHNPKHRNVRILYAYHKTKPKEKKKRLFFFSICCVHKQAVKERKKGRKKTNQGASADLAYNSTWRNPRTK